MSENNYYREVGAYYDQDAAMFDERYWRNPVLQEIRASFRAEVKKHHFTQVLEIGIGTGLDITHFAQVFPDATFHGIDVSEEMCRISSERAKALGLNNVQVRVGSAEDVDDLFQGAKYDMVYVFFGALNTVEDLPHVARIIQRNLSPEAVLVLSFVNKWYLTGMLIELLKGRFKEAFARLRPVWGGYSPDRHLPSRCFTPGDVRRAFREYTFVSYRAYSILHPAWYYHRLNRMSPKILRILTAIDQRLNHTPLKRFGEYTLFTFRKK
jgi:ubiquinone/menaquinone biosynthesis C-methylase UbiE